MRIALRVTELFGDALLKFFRDEMFQAFSIIVELVDGIAEHVVEKVSTRR